MRALFLTLLPAAAWAAPQFLSHSGRLLDPGGIPIDDTVSLTFELLDPSNGDSVEYSQTSFVPVQSGYYSVEIGAVNAAIFDADLDIRVSQGGTVLSRQTLSAVPYALSVDGTVRVSGAPPCTSGLEGTLRYNAGSLEVCNGTTYDPVGRSVGVVDYQYEWDKTARSLSSSLAFNTTSPPGPNDGYEVADVTLAAKAAGNILVLDGQVVYTENGNSSNSVTMWVVRESDGQVLAVVADSVHSNAGGCAYDSGYQNLCTTNLHYAFAAPNTNSETYSFRIAFDGGSFLLNRSQSGYTRGGLTSGLTVMEIAL